MSAAKPSKTLRPCKHESCKAFRRKEPKFDLALRKTGIVAHYVGQTSGIGTALQDTWMLSGITPLHRSSLERMIYERGGQVPQPEGVPPDTKGMVERALRNSFPTGTEAAVCDDIAMRQMHGFKKYGTTVRDNPLSLRAWMTHAYEETLDQAIYLKRAIEEMDKKKPQG